MKKTLALALCLFAAACGDNKDLSPDGGVDHDSGTPDSAVPVKETAVVAAGDFVATGLMSSLDVEAKTVHTNVAPASSVGKDPILRKLGNELFVVNRVENNITILKASDFSLVEQVGTGAGSNPQDVAVVGNKVFVANYGGKGVTVFTRGSSTTSEIDLSADDPDGKPNCASVISVGTKVFVACQLGDDANFFAPRGNGKVYAIDATNNTKTGSVSLTTPNPFSLFVKIPENGVEHAGDLLIGTVNFADGSGCIERITPLTVPMSGGCLIENSALGGFAQRMDIYAPPSMGPLQHHVIVPSILYVLVPRSDFSGGDVRAIQLGDDSLLGPKYNASTQPIGDVAVCPSGTLIMAESPPTGAPASAPKGLRIYQSAGSELTTTALDIGIKPASSTGLACY